MPTFPKLPSPVTPAGAFVLPATVDAARAAAAVQHAVKDGLLKPSDIQDVELAEPALLYVPFWRIGSSFPRDAHLMVCARRDVPYELKPTSALLDLSGVRPLDIHTNDLIPRMASGAYDALEKGEVVDADIDQERAEAMVRTLLLNPVTPMTSAAKKLASTFVLYPVYFGRYFYSGESRRHAGEELFVAVSGRTGQVLFAKHPSAARAMATKLRKLLSFDRR